MMNNSSYASRQHGEDSDAFQFGVRHLFVLMSLVAVHLSILRTAGPFVTVLSLGVISAAAILVVLRVENMIVGGVVGALFAALVLIVAASLLTDEYAGLGLAWLMYPAIGYVLGVMTAAARQFSDG